MKILYVGLNFVPASGAPTELTYLSSILASRGHDVSVYTTNSLNSRENLFPGTEIRDVDGVKVHYFHRRASWRAWYYSPELNAALRENIAQFDVVHLYGFRSAQTTAAALAARRAGVPYVLTGRGSVTYSQGNAPFKRVFDLVVGKRILRGAARLLPFNTFEQKQYLELGIPAEQTEIIPLGIDPVTFENLPDPGAVRAKWGLEGKRVALFLGRFNRIKGLDMLLPALARAVRHVPNMHLCLAGSDSGALPEVERLIDRLHLGDHVTMMGYLRGDEKLQALVDADFLVLSSRYDLFPNVVCEAWACGKPVVMTEGCGIADWVAQRKLGLVARFDPDDFADAMERLAGDEVLSAELGARGRDYVFSELDSRHIAKRHEALYESIARQATAAVP